MNMFRIGLKMNALCLLETIYLYTLFTFVELQTNISSKKTENMKHQTKQTEASRKRYLVATSRL